MTNDSPIVKVEAVSFSYGETAAVRNFSLTVMPGEIVGLIGPDGAGKSALIKLLCGVNKIAKGNIQLCGFDIKTSRNEIKKYIGYLSQRFSLYGDLTVDENIDFFAEIHGQKCYQSKKEELLEFANLKQFRNRLSAQLSGGMKQKLALLCNLIHDPKLLLLDEPTVGVDPITRRDFWEILAHLSHQGMTILVSTPYLDEAERCHRVCLMRDGESMIYDTPQQIKALIQDPFVELSSPHFEPIQALLAKLPGIKEVQLFGERIQLRLDAGQITSENIINQLQAANLSFQYFKPIPPSIENIYISLLKESERKTL